MLDAVPGGHAGEDRDALLRCKARQHRLDEITAIDLVPAGEASQNDGLEALERAGLCKMLQHAIDAVTPLASVLEEKDAAMGALEASSKCGLQDGEVASKNPSLDALAPARTTVQSAQGCEGHLAFSAEQNVLERVQILRGMMSLPSGSRSGPCREGQRQCWFRK